MAKRCDGELAMACDADQSALFAVACVMVGVGVNALEAVAVRTPADTHTLDGWVAQQLGDGRHDSPGDGLVGVPPEDRAERDDGDRERNLQPGILVRQPRDSMPAAER